jgi:hypothetical protein
VRAPVHAGGFFFALMPCRHLHGGIQHSLKNHEGKGAQIVGEARPARCRLKEAAN